MEDTAELYAAWRQVQQLHDIWRMVRRRCEDPKCQDFKWYGARGIRVSPRWKTFRVFLEDLLAEIGPRPEDRHPSGRSYLYSLDRKDVNGDYAPGNIRWATSAQQAANRRPARRIQVSAGDRYGRLVVLAELEPGVNSRGTQVRRIQVRCDCGVEKVTTLSNLRTGTSSCGCLKRETMKEVARARFTLHDGVPGYKLGLGV